MWEKVNYPGPTTLVLVAALNEEEGIGPTLAEVTQHVKNFHLLVVDGNSQDNTVEVAKDSGAQVIFQEGKGKGDAIKYALKHINGNYEYVVLTDADFTYPAEFVPEMIRILKENPAVGMVCGNRFNSHFHMEGMHNVFYIGNQLLALSHNFFNGISLRDPLTGLRVVRWDILKGWKPKSAGFDIEVELNDFVEKQGYRTVEVEIPYRVRIGDKKLRLKDGVSILKRIVLLSLY
jgi:glycosyltransferase involved in cell wall biosynthesis